MMANTGLTRAKTFQPDQDGTVEIIQPASGLARPTQTISLLAAEVEAEQAVDWRALIRKHGLWALLLAVVGAIGGFTATVLATPQYQSRLLLEIQPNRVGRNQPAVNAEQENANLQTQILMIRSGAFLKRVIGRIQVETLPVTPIRDNFFTKLRTRVRPEMRNSAQLMEDGINLAVSSLQVREVNRTNLVEITAESIHPELAATFVNTVGSEFVDQNLQTRSIDAQRASQWLAAQVEETKLKLNEAEEKLQSFIRSSGNLFVAQDTTLADSSLRQFQDRLTTAKADRIAKQAKYELFLRSKPEEVVDLLEDASLRGQHGRLVDLRAQRSQLTAKYTANHYKVQQLDAQIRDMELAIQKESATAIDRIKNDYDSAVRQERLLGGAYSGAAGQVSAQAGQSAQYSALKREVEILRAAYTQILGQANEAGIVNALPQNNMRILDAATPASDPLKPVPSLNIAIGVIMGLAVSGGIAYLRERADRSVKRPGSARELLSARELGVIPSLGFASNPGSSFRVRISLKGRSWLQKFNRFGSDKSSSELMDWQEKSFFAESFRHTTASILRADDFQKTPQVVLITSPNPSEGKTMVSSNLAISFAEMGKRVLLIDADFRRPRIHAVFGLSNDIGLGQILVAMQNGEEAETLSGLSAIDRFPGLSVLVNGPELKDLQRILNSDELEKLLMRLREQYDLILIDAAPILQIADVRMIDHLADGLALVLRCGVTDRKSALEAYRCLKEDGAMVLGTILNDWRPSTKRTDNYYRYVREEDQTPARGRVKPMVRPS